MSGSRIARAKVWMRGVRELLEQAIHAGIVVVGDGSGPVR
jgi:hypothetical protein